MPLGPIRHHVQWTTHLRLSTCRLVKRSIFDHTVTTNSVLGHGPLVSEHAQTPLIAGKHQAPRSNVLASSCLGATSGLSYNSTANLLTSSSYGASYNVANTQTMVGPGFPSVVGTTTLSNSVHTLPPKWPGPVGRHQDK